MRDLPANSIASSPARLSQVLKYWWLQAGFPSSAYRLAHLTLPRPVAGLLLLAIFYLA